MPKSKSLKVLLAAVLGLSSLPFANPALAATSKAFAIGTILAGESRVLDSSGTTAGSRVNLSAYVPDSSTAAARQRWTYVAASNTETNYNEYTIKNVASGLCLGNSGDVVQVRACGTTTVWYIPLEGNLYMQMRAKNGTAFRCLDATRFAGTTAQLTTCNDEINAQAWKPRQGPAYCTNIVLASLCTRFNPPMQGVFANWADGPVTFTGSSGQSVREFISGQTVNAQYSDTKFDTFEIGRKATQGAGNSSTYESYWLEQSSALYAYHPIAQNIAADGVNHTYMALPSTNGQLDILLDYNTVGTTTITEGPRVNFVETGISSSLDLRSMRLSAMQHRVQTFDQNGLWQKLPNSVSLDSKLPCNGPTGSAATTPPNCADLSAVTQTGSDGRVLIDYLAITQPASLAAAGPVRRDSVKPAAAVINGVDQTALAACMASSGNCLATVPGLRACVQARKSCSSVAARIARSGLPTTDAQARAMARKTLLGAATNEPMDVRRTTGRLIVSGTGTVRGVDGVPADRPYQGFVLTYNTTTGDLLQACLGAHCSSQRKD